MNYSIDYVEINGRRNNLIFVFDKPFVHIGGFLWAESDSLKEYVKCIDNVLEGNKSSDDMDGNAYCVYIKQDFSIIEDMLANDDELSNCVVNTMELKKIILDYIQKRTEFLKSKKEAK